MNSTECIRNESLYFDTRGSCGIGIFTPKFVENVGTLWRTAYQLGADFVFTIGSRLNRKKLSGDTCKSYRHIPHWHFDTWDDFVDHTPRGHKLVGIEFTDDSLVLSTFKHPGRCCYILGSEASGIPENLIERMDSVVHIPCVRTPSYNVALAGGIVLFDRLNKLSNK